MTRRVQVLWVLLMQGCAADDAQVPIEAGTYEVTLRTEQDTGRDQTPAPGAETFTVTLTPGALTLAGGSVNLPSLEILGSGSAYHVAEYFAAQTNCEAGPNKTCRYSSTEVTVTGHASHEIRIESCSASKINFTSCSANPSCTVDDAATAIGANPCKSAGVVEGDRIGP